MSRQPWALVAGAGPGLGLHLVHRLSAEGFNVFGLNRSSPEGDTRIVPVNLADAAQVRKVISDMICKAGAPHLVIHSAAKLIMAPFEETPPDAHLEAWQSMVLSAVNVAHATLPTMVANGGGAFLVSGATASLRGGARFSAFASAKAGLRALTQSLAREYGPKGIHVAHVILDGILDTQSSRERHGLAESRMMKLDDVADAYLHLAGQPRSAWTFEMDLRPMGEAF
jgi:NAD(P)-dependent dehydrogenase (short-subunit alcohol dehydrogenase family)